MSHFLPSLFYILLIGYLPLLFVTIKAITPEKLKSGLFLKLIAKDFIRTLPICALVYLPIALYPTLTKGYLIVIHLVFMPLMFLEVGHIYLFGTRIGLTTFYSFFATNVRETREFISQNIPPILYIGAAVFILLPLIFLAHCPAPSYSNITVHCIVVMVLTLAALPFIQNCPKKWPKFKDGYVLNPYSNLVYHFWKYRKNYQVLRQKIKEFQAPAFNKITSVLSDDTPQTYIIVIGESANRMHFSAYGYPRATNEFTGALTDEVLWIDGARSPFAQTMPALERILSFADADHPDYVYQKGSIIDYFKQAGFKTYWLSNQYAMDELETVITAMTSHADWNKCYNYGGMKRFEKAGLDGDLLPDIQKIVQNNEPKKVIFVHLIGSHSAYANRYPATFQHFTDELPGKHLTSAGHRVLNAYDDSIRYTDWVIAQIIESLKPIKGANYVLYFSDHGEDVFDTTDKKLLGHSELANEPMTAVPLMLWLSLELRQARPDILARKPIPNSTYPMDNLIHFIIDISSLSNKDYSSDKSALK